MAYNWTFKFFPGDVVFTDVLSFSGSLGRQNYNDNYGGGSFNITIKNNNNQVANFTRGKGIKITLASGASIFQGIITNIDFNDDQGNTGLSTATITCVDLITVAGKTTLKNFTYPAAKTITQAKYTNSLPDYVTPTIQEGPLAGSTLGLSDASAAASYSGTILNRVNLLCQTEKGLLEANESYIYFLSRADIATSPITVSLTRNTVSSTTIAYENIKRIQAGDNFYNQVTVVPESVAEQQANNTTSQTAYGLAGYQISTVDATTTQASGLASYLSTMQGDPTTLRYEVTFTDIANTTDAFADILYRLRFTFEVMLSLQWQAQGQSLQTVNTIFEGMSFSGTPSETRITLYLSPSEYYQNFILNSSVFGILDTSRLSW